MGVVGDHAPAMKGLMRLRSVILSALLLPLGMALPVRAATVELLAPLSTMIDIPVSTDCGYGPVSVAAELTVPDDAPGDLGVGAFIVDRSGRWHQHLCAGPLVPGKQRISVRVDADGAAAWGGFLGERHGKDAGFFPGARAGIFFWSSSASHARIVVDDVSLASQVDSQVDSQAVRQAGHLADRQRLLDLRVEGVEGDRSCARVEADGVWGVSAKPASVTSGFAMALYIIDEQSVAIEIPALRQADGRWRARFHPLRGGSWKAELLARWTDDGVVVRHPLPPLEVSGPRRDPFPDARALELAAPLDTTIALVLPSRDAADSTAGGALGFAGVELRVAVPDDAPADLSVGLVMLAADGSALHAPRALALAQGVDRVRIAVEPCAAASARLVFWSASDGGAVLKLSPPRVLMSPLRKPSRRALLDARLDVDAGKPAAPAVGACVTFSARPVPSASAGALDATALERGAAQTTPTTLRRGIPRDRERRSVSFHPFEAGAWELRARMAWSDGAVLDCVLPSVDVVAGADADRAEAITVGGPLPTLLPLRGIQGPLIVSATILVPDDAPADLGVGVYACDRHGRWYQHLLPGVLEPGIHRLRIDLGATGQLAGVAHQGRWSAAEAAKTAKAGLMLWTADPHRARVLVSGPVAAIPPEGHAQRPELYDLRVDEGALGVAAGERWSLSVSPATMPENPYDAKQFSLDLVVATPDGTELRIPGYYFQPMRSRDRGDREELAPSGAGRFAVRYRPSQPGSHRLRLEAAWRGGGRVSCELDPLVVSGKPWDGMVRVDAIDPRFFRVGDGSASGACFWPLGPNLRSVWDLRSQERMRTRVTPDRGTLAYHAYLERFALNGANAVEVWLAPWNLGLEWRADWPTFHGQGRYNEDNAWRLERVLDDAWAHHMRVNLVINNHGQGSDGCDAEWPNSPYNRANGGRLQSAAQVFIDPWALDGQERMRRYLVARYADHPALMGWKLWSEMDLTAGQQSGQLPAWHARAIERWHALDVYAHPVTSHWCGDYHHADPAIVAMPGFAFACIDAYHGYDQQGHCELLADLLRASALDPQQGLARYRKPFLVTEFGGDWSGTPSDDAMLTEHLTGPWAALVSGHGGAPMLWWFEWIDQGARWQPYTAMSRFLVGEDPRGGDPCDVGVAGEASRWWSGGWRERGGTVLGYVLERRWGTGGRRSASNQHVTVSCPRPKGGGEAQVEWWDPDTGRVLETRRLAAGLGDVEIESPAFSSHVAFKLGRAIGGRGR